ncbi:CDP-diacylglycerol--glycerol-3-phosphate 3-phosphatidyltransferase [Rhizobium sp. SG2393]|uniref:CDP-diacylglycerol--glycerol-3-phosphate 3-phosphatidyltransferase n=1 Tax=Rhizobium sp. SG2393 TaxID=3276279 RepID=UPI00366CD3E0
MSTPKAYNIPNLLTYARILAVPLIVLCFFIEGRLQSSDFARWTAFWLFAVASVTDYLDGYLARIWNQTSNIGRMLDPIADKLLVASVLLLMAADRTIAGWTIWAAIIILCREILVSGLREYLAALKVSVPVTRIAKWKTAVQMVAIGLLLVGPALDNIPPESDNIGIATGIGLALLWAAALITMYTGYDYFRAGLKHIVDE